MMATVDLLWEQKHQQDERVASAEALAEQLQQHIEQLGVSSAPFRRRTSDAS